MKPQSDVLLISNVRNSMTMFEMQESLAFAYGPNSLLTAEEKAAIRKIILMDERTRRVRVYEMKEPALHGSGPRRRQGNNSIGETKPQEVRLTRMTHAASSTEEHRSPKPTTEVRPLGGVPLRNGFDASALTNENFFGRHESPVGPVTISSCQTSDNLGYVLLRLDEVVHVHLVGGEAYGDLLHLLLLVFRRRTLLSFTRHGRILSIRR